MRAVETTLAGLLDGKKQLQVPLFQRPYSWQETQLKQLWSDILEQAELIVEGTDGPTHFIGSVVHAPSPQNTMAFPRALIVDGQQRLTTLSLALAALRDHVAADDQEWSRDISRRFLVNSRMHGDDEVKVVPTQADRATYKAYITETPPTADDESTVGVAYRFFRAKLAAVAGDPDLPPIDKIEEAITSRLTLVEVTADARDNVYRIFQSLNNTGLDLTQADLLRNYIFMHLPTRGEAVYENLWTPLQKRLNPAQIEHLIWLHLVLTGENRTRRQDVYRAEQDRFEARKETDTGGEAMYEAYVHELVRRSAHYQTMANPAAEKNPAVRDALATLRRWDAEVTAPIIMMLLDRREQGLADDEQVARALGYVESYLVRRTICRIPSAGLNRIFTDLPGQMSADIAVDEDIHRLLSTERRAWPTDVELLDAILTKPFYHYGRANQRTFVLRRIEESYEHPEPVDFAAAKLTIEHVLPQTPGKEWLEVLAEDAQGEEDVYDLHARIQHTLGNLTLTAQNSKLSNQPFQRKQDLLSNSNLELNKRIAATERWGATEIDQRGRELAAAAIALWPAPLPRSGRPERGKDWSLLHQALAALPPGSWTTYGELAALIGSAAQPVGAHLAQGVGVTNAWRVLNSSGKVAENFRWNGEDRGDVLDILRAEGVRIDEKTKKADPYQRLTADDLARLLGLGAEE
ncbi:alkylated DNA nucleotide flippase Atl1 [Catenulispora sp. MAP12-49]|uniref:GmrSD restriction endonuclease domain-containing protein n=1 Tax=unclassified Catenulispora TaxID=414885 RepID=UPI0035199829